MNIQGTLMAYLKSHMKPSSDDVVIEEQRHDEEGVSYSIRRDIPEALRPMLKRKLHKFALKKKVIDTKPRRFGPKPMTGDDVREKLKGQACGEVIEVLAREFGEHGREMAR